MPQYILDLWNKEFVEYLERCKVMDAFWKEYDKK